LPITDDGETGFANHYCLLQSLPRFLFVDCCGFGPDFFGLLLDLSSGLGGSLQIGLFLFVCVGLCPWFAESDFVLLLLFESLPLNFFFPHCPFSTLLFFSCVIMSSVIHSGGRNGFSMLLNNRLLLKLGTRLRFNDFVAARLHYTSTENWVRR
jgi:hypothetical protein